MREFIEENYTGDRKPGTKRLGVELIERAVKRRRVKSEAVDLLPEEGEVRRKKKKRKKKKKARPGFKSSSSDSSSSESLDMENERKVQMIAKSQPGRLGMLGLKEALKHLRHKTGDLPSESLPPVMCQYVQLCLEPSLKTLPAITEAKTLAAIADALLRGELSQILDIVSQRLKSMELGATTGSFQVAQHLELVEVAPRGLAGEREMETAAKSAQQERKVAEMSLGKGWGSRREGGPRPHPSNWGGNKGDGKAYQETSEGPQDGSKGEGTSRPSALKRRSESPSRKGGGKVTWAPRPYRGRGLGKRGRR